MGNVDVKERSKTERKINRVSNKPDKNKNNNACLENKETTKSFISKNLRESDISNIKNNASISVVDSNTSIFDVNLEYNLTINNSNNMSSEVTRKNSMENEKHLNYFEANSSSYSGVNSASIKNNDKLSTGLSSYQQSQINQKINLEMDCSSFLRQTIKKLEDDKNKYSDQPYEINENKINNFEGIHLKTWKHTLENFKQANYTNIKFEKVVVKPKTGLEHRNEYLVSLIEKKILFNNEKNPYNSIFFFDWDDTLLPSTFITELLKSQGVLRESDKQLLAKIEFSILRILTYAIENRCFIYIFSGADKDWIKISSKKYLKSVYKLLKECPNIRLIYTRNFNDNIPSKVDQANSTLDDDISVSNTILISSINNCKKKPRIAFSNPNKQEVKAKNSSSSLIMTDTSFNSRKSSMIFSQENDEDVSIKFKVIDNILSTYNKTHLTNVVTISHSIVTLDSVSNILKEFTNVYYKNLKLMDCPNILQVNKQLSLLADQLEIVYKAVRNINIKVKIK